VFALIFSFSAPPLILKKNKTEKVNKRRQHDNFQINKKILIIFKVRIHTVISGSSRLGAFLSKKKVAEMEYDSQKWVQRNKLLRLTNLYGSAPFKVSSPKC
jgi:hypothetical protein